MDMRLAGKIRERLDAEVANKKVLIAAHRGSSGGDIMENSPFSNAAAIRQKADMIEIDIASDLDGNFYTVHDGMELRLFGVAKNITAMTKAEVDELIFKNTNAVPGCKVTKLDDMLEDLKSRKCLVNVDRSWRYWDRLFPVMARHDMADQLLFKSPQDLTALKHLAAADLPYMFMPIMYSPLELDIFKEYDVNIVAIEIIFDSEASAMVEDKFFERLKQEKIYRWGNAIALGGKFNLSAWHDDNHAIMECPDAHWGYLVRKGFEIIQTDWPMLLEEYLRQSGVRK